MLELIGKPEFLAISTPNATTLDLMQAEVAICGGDCKVDEIGIGVGATTVEMAKLLNG